MSASLSGKKTRLAIYGGAFDPLHNGHLVTIAHLLVSPEFDQVVIVPSGDRPDKSIIASAADRLLMVNQAISEAFPNDSRILVSDAHVKGMIGHATIDLIDYFNSSQEIEPFVVIGSELLKDLPLWKEFERLRNCAQFVVVDRPGVPAVEIPPTIRGFRLAQQYQAQVLVSSTTVRLLIAQGRSCAGLVPQSVVSFCRERGLYRASSVS